MWAIYGPRSALDHPVYHWSLVPQQSLSAVEWHQSGKLTYCHALFLLPPETMESQRYQQSLSPGRTQIRSHCSKLNPPPGSGNHRGIHRAVMLQHIWSVIGSWFRECTYTQQQDSDSWISLCLWLHAHNNIFAMPIVNIVKHREVCQAVWLPCDAT